MSETPPNQYESKYLHLIYKNIKKNPNPNEAGASTSTRNVRASPGTSKQPKEPWYTDEIWGDDLPEDIIEECMLMATQTTDKEESSIPKVKLNPSTIVADINRRVEAICAQPEYNQLQEDEPRRLFAARAGVGSGLVFQPKKTQGLGDHSSAQRKQTTMQEVKPQRHSSNVFGNVQKLTPSQRKLETSTKSLSSASQATTEWLRSQLEKTSSECQTLKTNLQCKEGESKLLREKLQKAEREIVRQKQEKLRELELVKQEMKEKVKTLEKQVESTKTQMLFKSREAESNLERYRELKTMSVSIREPESMSQTGHWPKMDTLTGISVPETRTDRLPSEETDDELYEALTQQSEILPDKEVGEEEITVGEQVQMKEGGGSKEEQAEESVAGARPDPAQSRSEQGEVPEKELVSEEEAALNWRMWEEQEEEQDDDEDDPLVHSPKVPWDLEEWFNWQHLHTNVTFNWLLTSDDEEEEEVVEKEEKQGVESAEESEMWSDESDSEVDVGPVFGRGPILIQELGPEIFHLADPEINTIILHKVDYDPSNHLNLDFTEMVYDGWWEDPSRQLNSWDVEPDFSANPAIRPYKMPPEKVPVVKDKKDQLLEQRLAEDRAALDRELTEGSSPPPSSAPGQAELPPQRPPIPSYTRDEEWFDSRHLKSLEGLHITLLKLSQYHDWDNSTTTLLNEVLDYVTSMTRELYSDVCDPRHLAEVNEELITEREKMRTNNYLSERHNLQNLFSPKKWSSDEKYVDLRRGIAILAKIVDLSPEMAVIVMNSKDGINIGGSEPKPSEGEAKGKDSEAMDVDLPGVAGAGPSNIDEEKHLKKRKNKTKKEIYDGLAEKIEIMFKKAEEPNLERTPDSDENLEKLNSYFAENLKFEDKEFPSGDSDPIFDVDSEERELNEMSDSENQDIESNTGSESIKLSEGEMPAKTEEEAKDTEEIAAIDFKDWDKAYSREVDPAYDEDFIPFLEVDQYRGDKATPAEKQCMGILLENFKKSKNNMTNVIESIENKFQNEETTEEVTKTYKQRKERLSAEGYMSSQLRELPAERTITSFEEEDDSCDGVADNQETEDEDNESEKDNRQYFEAQNLPDVSRNQPFQEPGPSRQFLEPSVPVVKGKRLKRKVDWDTEEESSSKKQAQPEEIRFDQIADIENQLIKAIPVKKITSDPPLFAPKNFLMCQTKDQRLTSLKKGKVAPLKVSSKAMETRQKANENFYLDEEEMEREIDRLYEEQSQKMMNPPELTEEEKIEQRKEQLPIEYFLEKKTLLELFREFRENRKKGLLDLLQGIVASTSYMKLTLKFNPLFVSIAELLKMLLIRCDRLCICKSVIQFLMTVVREMVYCQPSVVVLAELQTVIHLALQWSTAVILLCHNPSDQMSLLQENCLRFFRGTCLVQVLCFQMNCLDTNMSDSYWDCVLRMLDWVFELYTSHQRLLLAMWYTDNKTTCKCVNFLHTTVFNLLSRLATHYSLHGDKGGRALVEGVVLASKLTALDPNFKESMGDKLFYFTAFLHTVNTLIPVLLTVPQHEAALLNRLLSEFEVKEDKEYQKRAHKPLESETVMAVLGENILRSSIPRLDVFKDQFPSSFNPETASSQNWKTLQRPDSSSSSSSKSIEW